MFLWPGYQVRNAIALWRHLLNAVHTAWQFSYKNPAQQCSLSSHLDAFLRCDSFDLTTLGSVCVQQPLQSIELSCTRVWPTECEIRGIGQFRCFLGLITSKITSKSAAIAFTGLSTQTSGGKLNLDRLLAYGRKINWQILNPERNLRIKRKRMEVSLQFAKLAVNVPNAKFIYIAGGDFCLDLSSTGTRRQRNF